MKRLLGFVEKEFYHIFRDTRTLVILFGMPIVQILLFGFAITNELKDAHISILDKSKDQVTETITQKLLSSGYFQLYSNLKTDAEIDNVFKGGKVKQVIIFEPSFAEKLTKEGQANIQLISDATDPNTGNSLINYTSSIIRDYQNSLNTNASTTINIIPEVRAWYNPELKGVFLFVPGLIAIILMLVSAMMTSISLTREKELGTMEVLLVSPMQPLQVIVAKVIPYVILSFINALLIIALGFYVFKVPVNGSLILLLAESILFIVMALSLGILISTRTNSQQTALMISLMGLMLPTIILSGFIFPIENMPLPLQVIANIIPAKWFVIIVRSIMLKGSHLADLWQETLILVGFTAFFIIVSIKNFNMRLQ